MYPIHVINMVALYYIIYSKCYKKNLIINQGVWGIKEYSLHMSINITNGLVLNKNIEIRKKQNGNFSVIFFKMQIILHEKYFRNESIHQQSHM